MIALGPVGTHQERIDRGQRHDPYQGWEIGDGDVAGNMVS